LVGARLVSKAGLPQRSGSFRLDRASLIGGVDL